eukprot:g14890.t1
MVMVLVAQEIFSLEDQHGGSSAVLCRKFAPRSLELTMPSRGAGQNLLSPASLLQCLELGKPVGSMSVRSTVAAAGLASRHVVGRWRATRTGGYLAHRSVCKTPLNVLSKALLEDATLKQRTWLTSTDCYTLCQASVVLDEGENGCS